MPSISTPSAQYVAVGVVACSCPRTRRGTRCTTQPTRSPPAISRPCDRRDRRNQRGAASPAWSGRRPHPLGAANRGSSDSESSRRARCRTAQRGTQRTWTSDPSARRWLPAARASAGRRAAAARRRCGLVVSGRGASQRTARTTSHEACGGEQDQSDRLFHAGNLGGERMALGRRKPSTIQHGSPVDRPVKSSPFSRMVSRTARGSPRQPRARAFGLLAVFDLGFGCCSPAAAPKSECLSPNCQTGDAGVSAAQAGTAGATSTAPALTKCDATTDCDASTGESCVDGACRLPCHSHFDCQGFGECVSGTTQRSDSPFTTAI